jgi:hypothetical protein
VATTDAAASQADVVIGIAGASAATLGSAIDVVRSGITQYLDPRHARIVVADSGPSDGAIAQAQQRSGDSVPLTAVAYDVDSRDLLRVPYHGLPGRVHALQALLEAARGCGASACAILDASLPGMSPDRIRWLVRPILDAEMDVVTAYFPRHPFEGAITKSILYPMFRAVFNCPIRQPAARDFGCSAHALSHLLAQHVWQEEDRDAAIDIWITTEAVCGGMRMCEAQLSGQRDVAVADVATTVAQVAGALFFEVEGRAPLWQRARSVVAVQRVGAPVCVDAPRPAVDVLDLIESFKLGYAELNEVWREILPPLTILDLRRLARAPVEQFALDDRTWARIVYDFAVGYHLQTIRRDHLLGSLTPLYLGWLSSFVLECRDAEAAAVDARLERVCRGFEAEKPYMISRWRWPERFQS